MTPRRSHSVTGRPVRPEGRGAWSGTPGHPHGPNRTDVGRPPGIPEPPSERGWRPQRAGRGTPAATRAPARTWGPSSSTAGHGRACSGPAPHLAHRGRLPSWGTSRRGPGTAAVRFHRVSALPTRRFTPGTRAGPELGGEGASGRIQPASVRTHRPSDPGRGVRGPAVRHRAPTPAVSGALPGAPPGAAPASARPGGPQHPACPALEPTPWDGAMGGGRRAQHCCTNGKKPPWPLLLAVLGVRSWASSDWASRSFLAVTPAHFPFSSESQTVSTLRPLQAKGEA